MIRRLVLFAFLAFPAPALASLWVDPDWATMITESKLIVRATVIEGGKFKAKVAATRTFRGTAPAGAFTVTGFNNHHWPAAAIEKESFKTGETYYLFLQGQGESWAVWTPTAGDLPVVDDKVRYSLTGTGYSLQRDGRPVAGLEELLRATLAAESGAPDPAFLKRERDTLAKTAVSDAAFAETLIAYELGGGAELLPSFQEVAKKGDPDAQLAVARIAERAKDESAWKLLKVLLDAEDGAVQGQAVAAMAAVFPADRAGPELLARLSRASKRGRGPSSLMDPVRNEMASGHVAIIEALGEMKYAPAEKSFLALLEEADERSAGVLLQALDGMGSKGLIAALEKRLDTDDFDVQDPTLKFIEDRKIAALRPAVEKFLLRAKSVYDRGDAIDALVAIGDPASAAVFEKRIAALVAVVPPGDGSDDSDEATDLVEGLTALKAKGSRGAVESVATWWLGLRSSDDAATRAARQNDGNALLARAKAAAPASLSVREVQARWLEGAWSVFLDLEGKARAESVRAEISKTLALPERRVGVRVWSSSNFSTGAHDDDRFDEHDTSVILRGLCGWSQAFPDATPTDWPAALESVSGIRCEAARNRY